MRDAGRWARISGVRYRCKPVYAVQGLDEVAQFFYDVVLPEETRIDVLVRSFGLPTRVIENILADLLERNYAALDVPNGRIVRIVEKDERRPSYRIGDELLIWQDDVIGAFLPAASVERYASEPPGSVLLPVRRSGATNGNRVEDFIDAPNARIIGVLSAADASVTVTADGGVLDSLIDKQFFDEMVIYLPVFDGSLEGETIQFIHAAGIPSWLGRSWSARLERNRSLQENAEPLIARAHRRSVPVIRETSPTLFETCRFGYTLDRWYQAFSDTMLALEAERPGDPQRLSALRSEVETRVRSVSALSVASTDSTNHLSELWMSASNYLLVMVDRLDRKNAELILDATVAQADRPVHLIVACGSETDIVLPRRRQAENRIVRLEHSPLPELAIMDGFAARIGPIDVLLSRNSVIALQGRIAVRQVLLTPLLQEVGELNGGWWVKNQLQQVHSTLEAGGGSSSLSPLMDQFGKLHDDFERAREEALRGTSALEGVSQVSLQAPEALEPARSAEIAELQNAAANIFHLLPSTLADIGEIVVPVTGGDQLELFNDVLELSARSPHSHEVELWVDEFPLLQKGNAFTAGIKEAIAAKWRFHIVLSQHGSDSAPDISPNALEDLRANLGAEKFRVSLTRRFLPNTLILDDNIAAMSGASWFSQNRSPNCAFIVESSRFVEQLRSWRVDTT